MSSLHKILTLAQTCAEDLGVEIEARYKDRENSPTLQRRYDREMEVVHETISTVIASRGNMDWKVNVKG